MYKVRHRVVINTARQQSLSSVNINVGHYILQTAKQVSDRVSNTIKRIRLRQGVHQYLLSLNGCGKLANTAVLQFTNSGISNSRADEIVEIGSIKERSFKSSIERNTQISAISNQSAAESKIKQTIIAAVAVVYVITYVTDNSSTHLGSHKRLDVHLEYSAIDAELLLNRLHARGQRRHDISFLRHLFFLHVFEMGHRNTECVGLVRLNGQIIGVANQVNCLLFQIFASDAPLLKAEHLAPLRRQVYRIRDVEHIAISHDDALQTSQKNDCLRRPLVHYVFYYHMVWLIFSEQVANIKTHVDEAAFAVFVRVAVYHPMTDILSVVKNSPASDKRRLIQT
nr:MAG TPA: hypothetical protein [Caudoviricetes sp.]